MVVVGLGEGTNGKRIPTVRLALLQALGFLARGSALRLWSCGGLAAELGSGCVPRWLLRENGTLSSQACADLPLTRCPLVEARAVLRGTRPFSALRQQAKGNPS